MPAARQKLVVKGPWKNGATIPEKYTCDGDGTKPQVGARVPGNARDVALVMVDPDAPGGTFVHWTRWGRSSEGKNSFGTVGYRGPCPPKGDKPHHYVITVYALRGPLGLPSGSDAGKVVAAIRKKAYASDSLTGVYGR